MTNYCTAAEVRDQMPKLSYVDLGYTSDTDLTTLVGRLLPEVDKIIDNYTHRQFFDKTAQTEIFDGKEQQYLFPTQTPIISLTKVEYRSSQTGSWTEQTLTDFYAYDEYIWYEDRFVSGRKNYRITYEYGYASVPVDIKRAAIQITGNIVRRLIAAQDPEGKAPSVEVITPSEEALLRPYVKPAAAIA